MSALSNLQITYSHAHVLYSSSLSRMVRLFRASTLLITAILLVCAVGDEQQPMLNTGVGFGFILFEPQPNANSVVDGNKVKVVDYGKKKFNAAPSKRTRNF